MSETARDRAVQRIVELAGRCLDLPTLWREANRVIAGVVPHYLAPCWFTLDPASLLVTSHYQADVPELPPEWLAQEYYEDDVHTMAGVARSAPGISTLHDAAGGDPTTSARWRANMEMGADQELLVALRTTAGETWGVVGVYREPDEPMFDSADLRFFARISAPLADGARRGLLMGEATDPDAPDSPGLIVLAEDWSIASLTPGVERWLAVLPDGEAGPRRSLPSAVLAVAGRALRTADGLDAPGEVAVARVLARDGRWVVLHGAAMVAGGARRVAVIVEPAHPARIAPLLMSVYGLTDREQQVTRLVLTGESTSGIAAALSVSPHTVQQHLKTIFEKTGVRSRRELVGKVFFAHYEPRLRDNEARALAGRSLRGGPITPKTP